MKLVDEFRAFVSRGNVVDLAVGVVIGGAFTSLVQGVVKGIIDPTVALLTGKGDATSIVNGFFAFGSGVLNFLLLAAIVFFVFVKPLNKLAQLTAKPAATPKPGTEDLLTEIRDLLKERRP